MGVTIDDVAKHAGVSTATVSRYLNNSPYIAPKSREKVRKSMEVLNYQPSFVARSLAGANTSIIAFVVNSTDVNTYGNDYFLRIQYGIEATLGKWGYYLLIINVSNDESGESNIRKLVLEKRVDGMILPSELANETMLSLLQSQGIPFLVIGRNENASYDWVDINNERGGYLAAQRLLQNGCNSLAFITSSFEKLFVAQRFQGYQTALKEYDKAANQMLLKTGCFSTQDGETAASELLASNPDIDAFLCTDNVVGFGVLSELKRRNITVPQQIQVISFDNSVISELSKPKLSVVDIDVFLLGKQAAELLLYMIKNAQENPSSRLIDVSIITKGSSY